MQRNPAITIAKESIQQDIARLQKRVDKSEQLQKSIQMCKEHLTKAEQIYNNELKTYTIEHIQSEVKRMEKALQACEKAKEKMKSLDALLHQI